MDALTRPTSVEMIVSGLFLLFMKIKLDDFITIFKSSDNTLELSF